jgi:flagellar biosynthesis protein FlhF
MTTKTYLAKSVDEAITRARVELGADAMLLNTRRLPNEPGSPGGYEVVFVTSLTEPEPEPVPELIPEVVPDAFSAAVVKAMLEVVPQPVPEAAPAPPLPQVLTEDLAADLERLHSQMDEIRSLLVRSTQAPSSSGRNLPELAAVYERLVWSEVDPALSRDIVDRLEGSTALAAYLERQRRPEALEAIIQAELERRVGIESALDPEGQSIVLVGPPGGGKTTTLAKLASLAMEREGARPVRLLSLDTFSEASHLRLKEVAEALRIAFTKVESLKALPSIIAEAQQTEFVLIDTPGFATSERKTAEAMAAALAGCPGIETHLVVPGYMKSIDLRRCVQRYEVFRPSRFLVTKLDETHAFGSVFSEAARAGLALSFLTHGPMIPRDIRPASAEDLLVLALERQPARSLNVA